MIDVSVVHDTLSQAWGIEVESYYDPRMRNGLKHSVMIPDSLRDQVLLKEAYPIPYFDNLINKRNPHLRQILFEYQVLTEVLDSLVKGEKLLLYDISLPAKAQPKTRFSFIDDPAIDPPKPPPKAKERSIRPPKGRAGVIVEVRDGHIYIKSPFNHGFIDALKGSFHWSSRKWDKQAKVWSVYDDGNNYDVLLNLILAHYNGLPEIRIREPNGKRYRFIDYDIPPDWILSGVSKKRKRPTMKLNHEEPMAPRLFGDFFQILGVSRTADTQLIKKGYRKAVKQYHPDTVKQGGDADREAFELIQRAYDTLRDEKKRKKYLIALKIKEGQLTTQTGRNDDPLPF